MAKASVAQFDSLNQLIEAREKETLNLYRPTPQQVQVHKSGAHELVVRGGKRCLAGSQMIFDPCRGTSTRVDEIGGPFWVYGREPATGKVLITQASRPFIKGRSEFVVVALSNGKTFEVTREHRILTLEGWVSVEEAFEKSFLVVPVGNSVPLGWLPRDARCPPQTNAEPETLLHITSLTPSGSGDVWDFEVPECGNYELAGVLHHNSGKSLSVAVEFASRILGQQLVGPDGQVFPLRFRPSTKKNPGLYWIIGWAINHIGQTIHRLLFEPGLFRIIKDETGKWRVFNEADPADAARFDESENAPPLIPPRLIDPKGWSWENKAAGQFETCRLIDGTLIRAFPSSSRHAKQGDAVSGIWIDEDVQFGSHVKEWQDRLTSKNGWLIWSVWPHRKNYALVKMLDRADEQKLWAKPKVAEVQLVMSMNPFISKEAIENAWDRMDSETEIALRDRGEMLWEELMMYEFLPLTHVVKKREDRDAPVKTVRDVIEHHLATLGRMPHTWTRYLAIDPSHTRTAVLVGAVPPPEEMGVELGNILVIEKEIIAKRMSAINLAKLIRKETNGLHFETFVIDQNAGRQTWAGREDSTTEHYAEAFAAQNLRSSVTDNSFHPGCNKPQQRYTAVRQLLAIDAFARPSIYFYDQMTSETQHEFGTYRKKQQEQKDDDDDKPLILDEPANPRKHDCMAALEYMVEYVCGRFGRDTAFVEPETAKHQGSGSYKAAQALKARMAKQHGGEYVHLGPGAAA